MRALRLLLAGLLVAAALVAGFFAAAVILGVGMAGYALQLFMSRPGKGKPRRPQTPGRASPMRTDDVIEVVATKVPVEKSEG